MEVHVDVRDAVLTDILTAVAIPIVIEGVTNGKRTEGLVGKIALLIGNAQIKVYGADRGGVIASREWQSRIIRIQRLDMIELRRRGDRDGVSGVHGDIGEFVVAVGVGGDGPAGPSAECDGVAHQRFVTVVLQAIPIPVTEQGAGNQAGHIRIEAEILQDVAIVGGEEIRVVDQHGVALHVSGLVGARGSLLIGCERVPWQGEKVG